MKKTMKRVKLRRKLLALILALAMIVPSFPSMMEKSSESIVYADSYTWTDETNGVKFTYEDLNDGGVIINRIEPSDSNAGDGTLDLIIPDTIDGKAVKELASGTIVANPYKYKSITFNTSIETIPYPFARSMINVTSVTFPEGSRVSRIGQEAFKGCSGLTTITLPNSLVTIDANAFSGCSNLATVNFGSGLQTIGNEAFSGTKIAVLDFPDSLTSIGDETFYLNSNITSINMGSGLTSIGTRAFSGCNNASLTSIDFPDSLETIGTEAFKNCGPLQTIDWPENNPRFTTISESCFEGCSGLSNDVLENLPTSVTTISDKAFYKTKFTEITIPWTVTYVGKQAFAENQNNYSDTATVSITIEEGSKSLTIDEKAFYLACRKVSNKVTLPKRVSVINDSALSFTTNSNEFTIYNNDITINGDPWKSSPWTVIKYPSDLEMSESFNTYMATRKAMTDDPNDTEYYYFTPFDTIIKYTVSGTVPAGATLVAKVNGTEVNPGMVGNAFSFKAVENSMVVLNVSLDGYKDGLFAKTSSEFTADWNKDITTADLTPIEKIGNLSVMTEGTGGVDANVSVFDNAGELVASDTVNESSSFLLQELPAGTYTVVAFEKNAYISGISTLNSLGTLGIDASDYAKATATVTAGETVEVSLNVPSMPHVEYGNILDEVGSFVAIDRSLVTKNLEFFGKVFYRMQGSNKANKIKIVVPKGLTVKSVTVGSKSVNVDSVLSNGVITIDGITGKEAESGTIYVGLKSPNAGAFCLSASVESKSGITVPIGSADFNVEEIILEVKDSITSSRKIPVTVWSEPSKTVKVKAGSGAEITGTTNKIGCFTGEVELPAKTPSGTSHVIVATVGDDTGEKYRATERVFYEGTKTQLDNFYFVHANHQYNLVKNGVNKSGGFYTYVADGKEATKNWTFAAEMVSSSALTGDVNVVIHMLDGSVRNTVLSPTGTETLADGRIKTNFSANIYIENLGVHVFDDALVPEGFDLDYVDNDNYELVTDEAYTEYLDELVEATLDERKRRMLEIMGEDWTQEDIEVLLTQVIVGGGYHISDNPDYADEFNSLSPADQESIINFEHQMDDLFDVWADFAQDVKPMYDYNSLDDYIRENWWDCNIYPDSVPADFEDEGFIVSDDGSFAYTEDGRSFIRLNDDGSCERIDIVKDPEKMEKPIDDDTMMWIKQLLMGGDQVSNYMEEQVKLQKYGPKTSRVIKGCTKVWGLIGFGFSSYDTIMQSNEYVDGTKKTDEYAMQYADLHNESKWAEHKYGSGKISMECLKAIRAEEMAAYELARAGARRDQTACAGCVVGTASFVIGGALLAAGATAPLGMVVIMGGLDYYSFNELNMKNVDVANALAAVDRAHLARKYKCNPKYKANYKLNVIFDPSGFVYEAVESNRVEGALATVVYDSNGADWDATEYNQVNPQTTDREGTFAWDVPTGTYKVKVTKDGYDEALTEPINVPPPRMDLKIPLVTSKAPEIESLNVYPDYTEIIFNQYMKIDDESKIEASIGGVNVADSSFEWQDPESSPEGKKYSKVVRIPTPAGAKVGDNLNVKVSKAENYAGKPMAGTVETNAKVSHRPSEIILNYDSVLTMQVGSSKNITVRIKDENGDYMKGVSLSAFIDNEYLAKLTGDTSLVTDEEGKAVFKASALLPGLTNATIKVDGTTLKKSIDVQIETEAKRPKRPTAEIAGQVFNEGSPKENYLTVTAGSMLTLSCATEGATIYYTLDDTCPCQNKDTRYEYTGPIKITKDVRIRIAAYKDGLEYSERLNLNITVTGAKEFEISYDLNGGTLNGKTGIIVEKHFEGEEITIPDAPTREGYVFDYWEGSKHYPGDKYTIVGDHTFKAVWIAADGGDGGDGGEKTDTPGNSNSDSKGVKTGDSFNMALCITLLLLSIVGITFVIRRKGRLEQ